jgi:hypothetical protein
MQPGEIGFHHVATERRGDAVLVIEPVMGS